MTREKKLEAIYKEMADTDIDEWCIIEAYGERWTILDYNWTRAYVWRQRWDFEKFDDYQHLSIKFWYKVIWKPVMIWDVLDYFKDKRFYCTKCKKIVDWRDVSDDQLWGEYYCDICNTNNLLDIEDDIVFYWFKKRESIVSQEDQCIDYIYNLIGK